jgi:hypothetical protein
MHASLRNLPITIEEDGIVIREVEWEELHVGHESFETAFDVGPLFQGLPEDLCQCPHWGYVIRGRLRVRYADREEVIEAGSVYYLPPGHAPKIDAGTEIIEFSPKEPYRQTMDVAARNFQALQAV